MITTKQSKITPEQVEKTDEQIKILRKQYDYDTKEFPVEVLVQKYHPVGDRPPTIFIPAYQRAFKWDLERRVKFIESVFLGLPIPPMLGAVQDQDGIEIIDGSQRLRTLEEFVNGRLRLELRYLKKLPTLAGFKFQDLSTNQQNRFLLRTIRMQVIWNESDVSVRADIFNRINTRPLVLTASENRKGALDGPFYDFILECSANPKFIALSRVAVKNPKKLDERQELVTRFFTYSETYLEHKHDVASFIDNYVKRKNADFKAKEKAEKKRAFVRMLDFVEKHFRFGFRKQENVNFTPRVRFEAIAVGVHLALQEQPNLVPQDMRWLDSDEFSEYTTSDASNNPGKLKRRIEFVRDCLLNAIKEHELHYGSH